MLLRCIRAEREKLRRSGIWLLFLAIPVISAAQRLGRLAGAETQGGVTMLLRCIRAEREKLRRSGIWLLFLAIPVISAVYGLGRLAGAETQGGVTMLLRCIRAEREKLRRSGIWLLFLAIPVISAVYGTFNYNMNLGLLTHGWYDLWTQYTLFYATFFFGPLIGVYASYLWRLEHRGHNWNVILALTHGWYDLWTQYTLFYATFFFGPLIGVYASYLWRLEHRGHNWNVILAAPVRPMCLFAAKFWVVLQMALLTQLWLLVLFVLGGKLGAGLPGLPPVQIVGWLLRGVDPAVAAGAVRAGRKAGSRTAGAAACSNPGVASAGRGGQCGHCVAAIAAVHGDFHFRPAGAGGPGGQYWGASDDQPGLGAVLALCADAHGHEFQQNRRCHGGAVRGSGAQLRGIHPWGAALEGF